MDRIWLKSYPPGVPAAIDARRFASLGEMFEHSCGRFRERPALESFGSAISYGALERLARDFGAFLQKGLPLAPGDRIAIMLPNLLQYPVALFGALRAGLAVVNVNPLYTAPELAQQLADAKPAAIVVLENFAHRLQGALRPRRCSRRTVRSAASRSVPAFAETARRRRAGLPAARYRTASRGRRPLRESADR